MKTDSSRRNFLAAGLSLPVAGMASAAASQAPAAKAPRPKVAEAAPPARYRTLGKTGLKVSTVGYGCMITSDSSVISRAVDMGITYFDTARGYQSGNNERMVGAALKGSRNKVVISSKSESKTAAEAMEHLETSLKELGTDYLDIWYMHARDTVAAIPDEQIAVWENAKKQGKIRHIGISTHNPAAIVDRVLAVGKFEVVLSTYNFTVGGANDPAYKKLVDAGIGMVAMKVMAPASRAGGFSNLPGYRADRMDRVTKPGGPLAALKWVLRDQRFATTIPSMTDIDQLEMNFRAMSEPFTAAGRETAGPDRRRHSPALLPHVLPVHRPVPQGRAGRGHHPVPVLRGFLRAVRAWPGALPGAAGRGAGGALPRLRRVPGAMPQRGPRGGAAGARAGFVRVASRLSAISRARVAEG